MTLKSPIRKAREKAGLSMAEAAEKLGVTRAAISIWETGKGNPLLDNLRNMALLYGCTVDELMQSAG